MDTATGDIDRIAQASSALDYTLPEQLYYQLYNILFQQIVERRYKVGEQLPSEPMLVKQYNISRATVRRAMELLVSNGLVERRRGIGSTVISNSPISALDRVTSYLKRSCTDMGVPIKKNISAHDIPADEKLSRMLSVAQGTKLYELVRLRCCNDEAYYLEYLYVEHAYFPDIHKHDFSKESLRTYYFDIMHKVWPRASQYICAEVADEETAQLLQVEEGFPILSIYRVTFDENNIPREYIIKKYRSDRYYLEMSLETK